MKSNRREFLKFLGVSSVALSKVGAMSQLVSCSFLESETEFPSQIDDVILRKDLSYYPIISWGEPINSTETFGFNNDYITYKNIGNNELLMWVNHEYTHPLFVSGYERTKDNIDKERRAVGGSVIKLKMHNRRWKFDISDSRNRGVRGDTKIPFANGVEVQGSKYAIGTNSNCAGGLTPWNTFLSCEENSDKNYGTVNKKTNEVKPSVAQWEKYYPHPVEHYQWVVEIDPETANAKKHTNLGRFAHESATPVVSKSNHVVVYSGDDKADEHLYKFISKTNSDFDEGVLYVANLEKGQWLPIDLELSPVLKKSFKRHIDLMVNTRKAAKILGATKLNRPEDIEIHPKTGDVYVALTNNTQRDDFYGKILKISEKDNDHSSLEFSSEDFIVGGKSSGLACPDNLVFDSNGNLWIANDISGYSMNSNEYKGFGNNGIFVVPTSGDNAGNIIQIASAPNDAEFTGICFSPDEKTLFVSVQHPGELTRDLEKPTSTWPTGTIPKPSVIAIEGGFITKLTGQS